MKAVESSHTITHDEGNSLVLLTLYVFFLFSNIWIRVGWLCTYSFVLLFLL